MNARGKSDGPIVRMSPANNDAAEASAEPAEGKSPARRNTDQSNLDRTRVGTVEGQAGCTVCVRRLKVAVSSSSPPCFITSTSSC